MLSSQEPVWLASFKRNRNAALRDQAFLASTHSVQDVLQTARAHYRRSSPLRRNPRGEAVRELTDLFKGMSCKIVVRKASGKSVPGPNRIGNLNLKSTMLNYLGF